MAEGVVGGDEEPACRRRPSPSPRRSTSPACRCRRPSACRFGLHCAPVRSEVAEPTFMATLFFSRETFCTARPTELVGTSRIMSTPLVEPLPREVDADIGLVLVVGEDHLDIEARAGRIRRSPAARRRPSQGRYCPCRCPDMSFITPMRMVFAAWARDSRGSAVTAPAVAPVASNPRRVIPSCPISLLPCVGRAMHGRPASGHPSLSGQLRTSGQPPSAKRPEGLLRRRGLQQLVVVPGALLSSGAFTSNR